MNAKTDPAQRPGTRAAAPKGKSHRSAAGHRQQRSANAAHTATVVTHTFQPSSAKARVFRLTFDVEVSGEMTSCDLTRWAPNGEPMPNSVPLQHRWTCERWMMALAYDLAHAVIEDHEGNLATHITSAAFRCIDISVQGLSVKKGLGWPAQRKRRLERARDAMLDEYEAKEAAWKHNRDQQATS